MQEESSYLDKLKNHMETECKKIKWDHNQNTNFGGTGGSNAFYGSILDDGSLKQYAYPCHAYIHQFVKGKGLWTAWKNSSGKAGVRYFDWLVNSSPWAAAGIVPDKVDKEYMISHGFVWDDLDKRPASLFHNFLVAIRSAAEWSKYIQVWDDLVQKEGIDPGFAYLVLTVWCRNDPNDFSGSNLWYEGKVNSLVWVDKYDWPLDMARATEEYVVNFVSGNPSGLRKETFYPTARTKPVNTVWGPIVETKGEKYVTKIAEIYKDTYKLTKNERLSKLPLWSSDQIINCVKKEQDRLNILKISCARKKAA